MRIPQKYRVKCRIPAHTTLVALQARGSGKKVITATLFCRSNPADFQLGTPPAFAPHGICNSALRLATCMFGRLLEL
jgi:hypothetical protein